MLRYKYKFGLSKALFMPSLYLRTGTIDDTAAVYRALLMLSKAVESPAMNRFRDPVNKHQAEP